MKVHYDKQNHTRHVISYHCIMIIMYYAMLKKTLNWTPVNDQDQLHFCTSLPKHISERWNQFGLEIINNGEKPWKLCLCNVATGHSFMFMSRSVIVDGHHESTQVIHRSTTISLLLWPFLSASPPTVTDIWYSSAQADIQREGARVLKESNMCDTHSRGHAYVAQSGSNRSPSEGGWYISWLNKTCSCCRCHIKPARFEGTPWKFVKIEN